MLALALLLAAAQPLLGAWTLLGQPFASFDQDGSCTLSGEACTWRADKQTLFITGSGETEAVPFTLDKGVLTLVVDGAPIVLTRPGKNPAPAIDPSPPTALTTTPTTTTTTTGATKRGKVDPKDPLAGLLLSSPWCKFHYNQTTGYSSSTRVQYFADGTYQIGARGEGYSSGAGGTFASQSDTGSTGKWYVEKSQLMATPPPSNDNPAPTAFVLVPLVVTRNNNGYPIITALGDEYSQCQ